jgi:DNA-binding MarR family transcriptional regulator
MPSNEMRTLIADIYEAAGALRMSGETIAASEGIKLAQWHLLDAITDPTMTVARAARRLVHARQSVQKTANEMVDAGYIEFVDNPDHRHSPLIRVTPRGEEIRARLHARADESHHTRFSGLSAEHLATTRETLEAISRATNEMLDR